MEDCLFCKIIDGKIPSEKVYESQSVVAFKDIAPQAPIHLLFVHKNHTTNINDAIEANEKDLLEIFKAIQEYTRMKGIDEKGFRIVTNIGKEAGQTIFHTHFHLLAGAPLKKFGV